MSLKPDQQRFLQSFKALKKLFPEDGGENGYNRPAFSIRERQTHDWLRQQLSQAGIQWYEDSIHNTFGRVGKNGGKAVGIGSHIDTVPHGGLYDGALGTLAALEVARSLKPFETRLKRDVLFTCFVGEEVNPLGGTFGSRALIGAVSTKANDCFTKEQIIAVQSGGQQYQNFLELHIEQAQSLETRQITIGIPTAIAGIVRYQYHFSGAALHAGATPMAYRKDALVHASYFIQQVYEKALTCQKALVATVGKIDVEPNTPTIIPGSVDLILEIRAVDMADAYEFQTQLETDLVQVKPEFVHEVHKITDKASGHLSETVEQVIANSATELGLNFTKMFSGANHDVNAMSKVSEAGLIFVPSHDGISHNPHEFTSDSDLLAGLDVLFQSTLALATT
ncbi:MAG: Zn-dependent hydrolase [Lactobacillus sp.]|nr:Zn-dependent hydrolase [Lactobacillus sp.]